MLRNFLPLRFELLFIFVPFLPHFLLLLQILYLLIGHARVIRLAEHATSAALLAIAARVRIAGLAWLKNAGSLCPGLHALRVRRHQELVRVLIGANITACPNAGTVLLAAAHVSHDIERLSRKLALASQLENFGPRHLIC